MGKSKYPKKFKRLIKSGAEFIPDPNKQCYGFSVDLFGSCLDRCYDLEYCTNCKLCTITGDITKIKAKIEKWRSKIADTSTSPS